MTPAPMRLRCPADDGSDPARHLAVDVRMPVPVGRALATLARLRCHCGAAMVIGTREVTT